MKYLFITDTERFARIYSLNPESRFASDLLGRAFSTFIYSKGVVIEYDPRLMNYLPYFIENGYTIKIDYDKVEEEDI